MIGLTPAAQIDPNVFRGVNPGYLTTGSIEQREALFYGKKGSFNPLVAEFDNFVRDTFSNGELQTLTKFIVPAPNFAGAVFTITGRDDVLFQHAERETTTFYPKARVLDFSGCKSCSMLKMVTDSCAI